MALEMIDTEEFRKEQERFEKKKQKNEQFFTNIAQMYMTKYGIVTNEGKVIKPTKTDIEFAMAVESNTIGYINHCIDIMNEKGINKRNLQHINFDKALFW